MGMAFDHIICHVWRHFELDLLLQLTDMMCALPSHVKAVTVPKEVENCRGDRETPNPRDILAVSCGGEELDNKLGHVLDDKQEEEEEANRVVPEALRGRCSKVLLDSRMPR